MRASSTGTTLSNQRFIYLTFIVGAILIGLTLRSATVSVLSGLGSPDTMVADLLPMSVLIGAAGAVLSFFIALRNAQAVSFTEQVIVELAKVTWPDREETINSSMVVIVATLFMAGSLAFFDYIWAQVTGLFLFTDG